MSSSHTAEAAVVERLEAIRVVPVVKIQRLADAARVATALVAGGLPCVEIGFRSPAAAAAIREARNVDGLLVGAGTVLSAEQVREAADAGAHFAVAPGTNEEVLEAARNIGLPMFPGVATATEIERARTLGLTVLKVFPVAQLGGVAFLRAVTATYPDVSFIPTGGVTAESLPDYLQLDSVLACCGTWIAPEDLLETDPNEVTRRARDAMSRVTPRSSEGQAS